MSDTERTASASLHILHVFRAPLGGLFRHVCDLAEGQKKAGHKVGIICGEVPGDSVAAKRLAAIGAHCDLGVHTIEMNRLPGIGDIANIARITSCVMRARADVIHGHGAKGGAYARLLPRIAGGLRVYTPHGGSLHFDPRSLAGFAFLNAERMMRRRTDAFIFESDFGLRTFNKKIGEPSALSAVIPNGVTEAEFVPVEHAGNAADFVFIGELRELKGIGVKIEFMGSMPARDAFALGRVVVVPSYHESLPYVVLEAAAAGMPVIATRVGGMTEIFGPDSCTLLSPRDIGGLADRMRHALHYPDEMAALAGRLRSRVRAEFSSAQMVDGVNALYRRLIEKRDRQPVAQLEDASDGVEGVPS